MAIQKQFSLRVSWAARCCPNFLPFWDLLKNQPVNMTLLRIKIFYFRQLIMIYNPWVNLDFNTICLLYEVVFKMLLVLPVQFRYRVRSTLRSTPIILTGIIRNPELFKPLDQHGLVWFQNRLGCKVCYSQLLNYWKQINFLVKFICRPFEKLAVEFFIFSATTTAQNKTPKVFWLVHEV